jgi:hypothetical protein
MCPPPIRVAGSSAGVPRVTAWDAAGEGRGLAVGGPARQIEVVFEPVDCLAQRVSFAAVPRARTAGLVNVAPQPFDLAVLALDFALLPLKLRDQLFARRRAPPHSHAIVIASYETKYKRKSTSSYPLAPSRTLEPAK